MQEEKVDLTDNSVDHSDNNINEKIRRDHKHAAPTEYKGSMKNLYLSRGDMEYSDVDS